MARPLRMMERPYSLFEVSCRCFQERFLLRPSAELNDLILGVIGRALFLYPAIRLYMFKFLSDHYHLILAAPDVWTLARFMNHINSNIARAAGRLHGWHGAFWSKRYLPLSIEDDAALADQVRYVLSQGCKEGLVARPLDWPGASSDRALLLGEKLEGTWYDRAGYGEALRRGKQVRLSDFATRYEVPLTRLPLLEDKSEAEARAYYREIADDIEQQTRQACLDEGRPPMGVHAVLNQDPFTRARNPKRSPAPQCLASTKQGRLRYRNAYRLFVSLYRQAVERLRRGELGVRFPCDCFLPPLLCPPNMVDTGAPS